MNNYYNDKKENIYISVFFGVGIGFSVLILLTLVFSLALAMLETVGTAVSVCSVIILCISALVCGFASAKKNKSKILIAGAISGFVFYLLIAVISAAVTKSTFSSVFLIRLIVSVVSSVLGSLLTAISGRKTKYI